MLGLPPYNQHLADNAVRHISWGRRGVRMASISWREERKVQSTCVRPLHLHGVILTQLQRGRSTRTVTLVSNHRKHGCRLRGVGRAAGVGRFHGRSGEVKGEAGVGGDVSGSGVLRVSFCLREVYCFGLLVGA
jgi:hypothetical protein